jgi:uncharacterized protein YlxW (UPF0749 family)
MKRILTLAIPVLLILAIFALSKQPAGYRRELEKRDEKYRTSLDSLRGVSRGLEIRGTELQEKIDSLSNVTQIALNKAHQWKQRYDQAKRTPVKPQPDSAVMQFLSSYR